MRGNEKQRKGLFQMHEMQEASCEFRLLSTRPLVKSFVMRFTSNYEGALILFSRKRLTKTKDFLPLYSHP